MNRISSVTNLTPQEHAVIQTMLRIPHGVSQSELIARLPDALSQATVSRIMSSLIKRGFLIKEGQTRGARFSLSDRARRVSTDPQHRRAVLYDPDRIGGYVPNKSRWLSEAATARMQEAVALAGGKASIPTTSAPEIMEKFLLDFSWASSSISGNRHNRVSTRLLIEHRFMDGMSPYETALIRNHHNAISALVADLDGPFPDVGTVQRRHVLMMRDLLDHADLGRLRQTEMQNPATSYRPSTDQVLLMTGLNDLLSKAKRVTDPFEASFVLFAGLSYLQAFDGGNNRMGRLLANEPLLRAELPPLSFNGIDRTLYALGLIAFYETATTSLLGNVFAAAYATSASGVDQSVQPRRVPQALEVHERDRIEPVMKFIFQERIPDTKIPMVVEEVFGDLGESDRKAMVGLLSMTADRASPVSAFLYGVTEMDMRDRNSANHSK
ncbi:MULTISPECIES: Fic family protein [unclassified Yoonia]|uniref:Fic family protein n=1 Tax=unclassified Yoonia TaxID=2629118 RepID=UPI002AFDF242|nr:MULTISPECIES: Fic family protein [unclassified Yoonia]